MTSKSKKRKTEADPYGMTNKTATARGRATAKARAKADPYWMTNKTARTKQNGNSKCKSISVRMTSKNR
jgi:hypothetical protein